MTPEEPEDTRSYKVVINHEEQYSIWPAARENALGWRDAGKQGSKGECLAYIQEVWTDMRPLSLRKQMEEGKRRLDAGGAPPPPEERTRPPVDDLVERLRTVQPVRAIARPSHSVNEFRAAIERGFVHILFARTGTELGVRLAAGAPERRNADFEREPGTVHLQGSLVLNYVKVVFVGAISLVSLEGTGRLEPVSSTTV